MKVDSVVLDRGLECCCEVDVRLFLHFLPYLTGIRSAKTQIPAGVIAVGAGITLGKDF